MKKVFELVVVTVIVGVIGWRLIRAFARGEEMKNLRKLFGDDSLEREILGSESEHLLGKWHKKNPDNPVMKYTEELVGYALQGDGLKCDLRRLATKLQGEFVDTLVELGYAVFLLKQGLDVTMEPKAPLAGPDLRAVKDGEYFVEIRRVQLDEARAATDMATEDVFERLAKLPSRHSVVISMTDEYSAHSPELKKSVRLVRTILDDLEKKGVTKATLYYHNADDYSLREGEETEARYDYADAKRLAEQIRDEKWKRDARFVARFDDTGQKNNGTVVGVLPLGAGRRQLQPDETYLRLRTILRKKQKQLPKASQGIILLEISDLGKLLVDEFTLARAFYGDLVVTFGPSAEGFPHDLNRKPNGFFLGTSRVSAVVIEKAQVETDRISISREVFPTNNPNAKVLRLDELKLFGSIAEGLENLCAEEL
ncbi:MAG TPA: hypothetical protein VEV41_16345 [Terriglobales bacterium]|nr:hypothetical protein [Terriglobales bacterium]